MIVMIVFAALLFATRGFLSFKYYFIPLGNYNAANDLVDNRKYDEAIEEFKKLDGFKNSKAKLVAVKEKQKEKIAIEKISHAYALCVSDTTKMATDKKSITVDSFGKYDLASLMDVETIISTLELPDSLYDEMCATNALMGRQRETYDNFDTRGSFLKFFVIYRKYPALYSDSWRGADYFKHAVLEEVL